MNEVKSPKKPLLYYYFVVMLLVMLFNFIAMPWISEHQIKDVDYNTFVTMTEQGEVGRVEIQEQSNRILFTSSDEKTVYKTAMVPDDGLVQRLLDAGVSTTGEEIEQTSTLVSILAWVLPIIIFVALGQYMSRKMMEKMGGGGNSMMFNMGKSNAKVYVKSAEGIKFDDVAGEDEAKENLTEVVNYLHDPSKYQEIGASMPKGILLVGPPGTGKTMLAKAVAGEANVPFFSMSGSEFVEMFVGMGASKVRDLFKQAKEKAPCIVFIDEIDAIGRARGKNAGFSGNDERENTLNQLLTEMDGFQTNTGVIVLAATNRADILDKALMRAGRFDRQIEVGLPDVKEREAIFNVHLRPLKLDPQLDREFLARQTPGFSGADIANVCNEAALIAARHNKKFVSKEDFLAAIDRIVGGLEKPNMPMTAAERRATAIHEAGHATVMWSLPQCDPVLKVTVVPRGRILGATWYVPDERRIHVTNEALQERLAGLLGGRIAEEVSYGTLGAGALSDLERATETAYAMVAYYGMSKKIGPISYYDSSGTRDTFTKPFSEQTAHDIDTEVRRIIEEAYAKARGIIERKSEQINRMADLLLEKETIYAEDIERILGPAAQVPRENDEPKKGVVVADDDAASGTASAPADAPPAGTGTTQEGDAGSASGTKTAASGAANAEKSELN